MYTFHIIHKLYERPGCQGARVAGWPNQSITASAGPESLFQPGAHDHDVNSSSR